MSQPPVASPPSGFRFDAATETWSPAPPPVLGGASPAGSLVKIVTWNVWFAPRSFEPRFRALLAEVRAQDPDVICLQEIIPESLALLLEEPWIRERYAISDATGGSFDSYGVVLLSRLPIASLEVHPLPSNMSRRLLAAQVMVGDRRLTVGTVHLESLKPNSDLRAEQLGIIFPLLRALGPDTVLTGDFNLCSSWTAENAHLDRMFSDLWPELHGRDPGYTENTAVNRMLSNVSGKSTAVRFDRILLRSARAWRARSIELLGTKPIPRDADTFPSDHFGLAAVIEAR